MWLAAKGLLSGIWGYIAAAGAALVGILLVIASAKKAGRDEVISASAKKEVEDANTARKVDENVARTKSDDVRRKLHERYTRD